MALDGILPDDDEEDEAIAESFPAERPGLDSRAQRRRPRAGQRHRRVRRWPTADTTQAPVTLADGTETELDHGHVVIAAITSCTNTSNPSVMLGAGILARNAVQKGLTVKPWVKTSLAPGSKVVTEYLDRAGLTEYLDALGFNLVGYGCTTCIGNSGPLPQEISDGRRRRGPGRRLGAVGQPQLRGPDQPRREDELPRLAAAVRRLRDRRHDGHRPLRRAARRGPRRRAGLPEGHLARLGRGRPHGRGGGPVGHVPQAATARCSTATSAGTRSRCRSATSSPGTSVRPTSARPPFFEDLPREPEPLDDIVDARVLAVLGDSVTTDHISPAGSIKRDGPAAKYLNENHVEARDFNSYGSRRGNHEVMMRGTFANIRLRNQLAPGTEGGVTTYLGATAPVSRCRSTTRRCGTSSRDPADRAGRQGVRLGLVARLGRQGNAAARRARGDRRELRADPPLEPRRHGRAAAAVQPTASRSSRWA